MTKYSKYEGLGNDFIILMKKDVQNESLNALAKQLCNDPVNGKTDGFIVVEENPLTMHFYNQDGSEGTMCGNGIRAFINYCYDHLLIRNIVNNVKTKAGIYKTIITSTNPFMVKVEMGKPLFDNDTLKIKTRVSPFLKQPIIFYDKKYELNCVFMGTHHTVVFIENMNEATVELGNYLCHLPIFDDRTNVDFVVVQSQNELFVKTYERGVGFTKACGTGACASFVIAKLFGFVENNVKVYFANGYLEICENEEKIYMTGPAKQVELKQHEIE